MKWPTIIIATLASSFILVWGASAEDRVLTVADYLDYETVQSPQISPDGQSVIYGRRWVDKKSDSFSTSLWITGADGSRNRELIEGSGARWSPDGTRIAFIAKDDGGKAQIFVRWMDAEGNVTQVTHGEPSPKNVVWSPDSSSIAFAARVPYTTNWTIDLPGKPKGAEWTEAPVVIDSMHFRRDRIGFINDGFDHIFTVPADGGTPRQITEGSWHVGNGAGTPGFSFSPDGTEIVFSGNASPDWEMNFSVSQIYTVDVASGQLQQLSEGEGNWTSPKFSPDGSMIAYQGFEEWVRTYPQADLYVMDADGSDKRAIGVDMADGPSSIEWAGDSAGVYFTMNDHGSVNLYYASLAGEVAAVTEGMHVFRMSSLSSSGRAVGIKSSYKEPGDVYVMDLSDAASMQQITRVNDDLFSNIKLGDVQEIWYKSTEDTDVQGWIVTPPDFDPGKKYPLILHIHGGPHGMYNAGFNFVFQEYVANDYVLLYTNPRGSTGYGREFANAIESAYPGIRDFSDLMGGVDVTIDQGYIDERRLFVTGCSGGGVLTTWTVGHTDRFAAAVARCPVVNWISFAGQVDLAGRFNNFIRPYFMGNPEATANWLEHSPIMHVDKVTTPTLLMTGDRDLRTPIEQAEEFYIALKIKGVPTKLLPMRGEWHGTGSIPSNWMRTQLYIRKWFEEYDPTLKAED